MLGFKKKMDFVDRDEVLRAKNETLRLTTQFSYEDIGRAFVDATRDLSYDDLDDVVKARFVNMVSFKCTMNLLARVRRPEPVSPPTPRPWLRRLGAILDIRRAFRR